jgi:biotin carboxyl carrier protein
MSPRFFPSLPALAVSALAILTFARHRTRRSLLSALGFSLCLTPSLQAIEITGSTLPGDTTLQILTGSVSYEVDVRGTTEASDTTYPYLVYVTGTDIYGNTVYLPVESGDVTVRGQRETFIPASGAAATAVVGAGQVTGFVVTSGGANYSANPVVTLLGGGGSGATAVSFINGGQVTSVVPNNPGSGYTSPPTVQFSGGGGSTVEQTATTDRISGNWIVPNDGTLHNITSGYRLIVAIYNPGSSPTNVADLANNLAVSAQRSGRLDIDVLPDLAVGVPGTTYQAGRYRGADIIQFNNTWVNDSTGEGQRESRPLRSTPADYYRADLRLSNNPQFGDANNDDFLLSRLVFAGDVPFIPNGTSIVRKVTVLDTPPAVPAYGDADPDNTALAGVAGTARDYTPQPDDGYLDIGERVTVSLEQLIPENYMGAYFVALRTTMIDEAEDASVNNTFVSNSANKIEILETASPTIEPASAVSTDNGTFVQNGDATSDYSSVSENGDVVAFSSRASNLLFLPNTGTGISTSGQQIFLKLRQTREVVLASRDPSGVAANADCFNPAVSADGRYVAFDSQATNLLQAATGSRSMIYVFDAETFSTVIVSRSSLGELADGDCFNPQISQSGRFIVFESMARNLDPARPVPPTNPNQQIYLHDRDSDADGVFDEAGNTKTYLVSVNNAGAIANGWCANPVVNLEDTTAQLAANGGMLVAFTSYATNMPLGSGYAMVYRVAVDPATGPSPTSVTAVSVNDLGAAPEAVGVNPVGAFIQPFADEAAINGDGSQIAFTSAANNFVFNPNDGTYTPTFPNNQPNDPLAPVDPTVIPAGDYNRVPDVFVRDFDAGTTVRVSVSQPRVATGTITVGTAAFEPSPPPGTPPGNVPVTQPLPSESITINDGASSVTLVFDTDVVIGATVFETRDNLVNAINASGLNIIAYASNPPSVNPPGTAYIPSIFLRNLIPGDAGNRAIETDSTALVVAGMAGGGTQAEDDALAPGDTGVAPIQDVPFGSNQPSIDRSGRFVAFRSIATNLDVHVATDENTSPMIPPMPSRPALVATGELIRPLLFETSNVYRHDRQADSDPASGFDAPLNTATKRVSLNKFGYKTLIDFTQQSGLEATQSANSSRPALSADGRFVTFSSDAFGEGGLVFGPNNLTPLDNANVRDVFIRDQRSVGPNPPPPTTRPTITINSPLAGLRVPPGSTIGINATAEAKAGKSIASVQLFINGVAFGAPLTAEPFSWQYTLPTTGTYSIRTVVTDSKGITSSDAVSIEARAPVGVPPNVAITQPAGVNRFVTGADLTLNVVASDTDGTIVPGSVKFFINGTPITTTPTGIANTYAASYRPTAAGTVILTAQATDNDGNTSVSVPVALSFVPASLPLPAIEILELLPGTPRPAGGQIPLRAEVNAAGDSVDDVIVQFVANGSVVGTATRQTDGTYLLLWDTPLAPGSFTVYARIIAPGASVSSGEDEEGDIFYYSALSSNFLTINTATGVAPSVVMQLPVDGTTAALNEPLTLRASAGGSPGVAEIQVTNPGSGYDKVTKVDVTNRGSGYTVVPTVTLSAPPPGGLQAVAVAVLGTGADAGKVVAINVTNAGSGYTTTPAVTLSAPPPGGVQATATAASIPPVVTIEPAMSIEVTNAGSGYTTAPTVTLSAPPTGGMQATANAVLGTGADAGKVERISVTNPGSGYTSAPTVTLSAPPPGGVQATAIAGLSANAVAVLGTGDDAGKVVGISVTATGSGYTTVPIVTVSEPAAGGVRATATAVVRTPTVASVQFYVNGQAIGAAIAGQPYQTTYTPTSQGSYVFSAVAIGTDGLKSLPDSVVVAISSGAAPAVTIGNPGEAAKYTPGTTIPISATATPSPSNTNARVVSMQFFVDGVSIPSSTDYPNPDTQAPFLAQFQVPGQGPFKLTAIATDNFGNVGAASVSIEGKEQTAGQETFINLTHPVVEYSYSTASDLYLNATVIAPTNLTVGTNDVTFFINGQAYSNGLTKVGNTFGVYWRPSSEDFFTVSAQVKTTNNGINIVSPPQRFTVGELAQSLPSIEMLPLANTNIRLGSTTYLQAKVNGGLSDVDRVDFYADQIFLGSVALGFAADNEDVLALFAWKPVTASGPAGFQITARAIQFVGSDPDNSVISTNSFPLVVEGPVSGLEPVVTLAQTPIAERNYVIGSELFLNATAVAQGSATINTNSIQFFYRGQTLTRTNGVESSGVFAGTNVIYTARVPVQSTALANFVFASAKDSNNNLGNSDPAQINSAAPLKALPAVQMLAKLPGQPEVAGGFVSLRAQATFPNSATQDQRVEFYANGAFVGVGTNSTTQSDVYSFQWQTPTNTNSFLINARAVDLNFDTPGGATTADVEYYSSVISVLPIPVNTIVGSNPVVSVTFPANNAEIPVNVPTFIRANASVSGSSIKEVRFYADGVQVGEPDPDAPYEVAFTPASPGPYQLYAIAETISGVIGVSTPAVVVKAVQGKAPTSFLTTPNSARATAQTNGSGGVSGYTMITNGSGYLTNAAPEVRVVSGTTNTNIATATALVGSTGTVTNVVTNNIGSGYTNGVPTVVIDPPPVAVSSNSTVLLQASAADTDGTIRQVEFLQNGLVVGTATGSPYNFTLPVTAAGRYELVARATDNLGNVTDSPAIVLTGVVGAAPTVSIVNPANTTSLTEVTPGIPVTVTVNASDTDGSVARVDLLVNGVVVGFSTQAPYIFTDAGQFSGGTNTTFTPPSEGTYVIVARATDNLGNVTDSAPVTVRAKSPTPIGVAPTVQITQPIGEIYYVTGSSMFLNARATDAPPGEVDPDSVEFTVNGLPLPGVVIGQIGDDYGVRYTPTVPFAIDTIRAQATDDDDNTAFSQPNFLVLTLAQAPLPQVQVLDPLPGAPLDAGGVIQLRAEAFFPPTASQQARVEFYANNVYVGTATQDATNPRLYTLDWPSPQTPAAYVVEARAVALNFQVNTDDDNVIENFGSVISDNSIAVNTMAGNPPVVAITSPAANASVAVGQSSTVTASASVPLTTISAPALANGKKVEQPGGVDVAVGQDVAANAILIITDGGVVRTPVAGRVAEIFVSEGETLRTGQPLVRLDSINEAGGTIERVEFYANGQLLGVDAVAPYSVQFTPESVGLYNLSAVAYSNAGLISVAPIVPVTATLGAAPEVVLTSATAARGTATVAGGRVTGITVVAPGTNYRQAPAVNLVGAAEEVATASATLGVSGVRVTQGGSGYTSAPTIVLDPPPAGGIQATASAVVAGGQVTSISVTNPGTGYTAAPTVTLNGGGGSGAAAFAVGGVAAINITNDGGNGYTSAPAVVVEPPPAIVGGTETLLVSATDPDGTIRQVEFLVNGFAVATVERAPYSYALPLTSAGTYLLQARATDNTGNVSLSNPLELQVVRGLPPVVSITSPANGSVIPAGQPIPITANASDPDGSVTSVTFFVNGTRVGEPATTAPYQSTFTATSAGDYSIVAVALDSSGNQTQSSPVVVTVPDTTITVAVTSPAAGSNYTLGTTVLLNAEASTTAGATITGVQFYVNNQPVGAPVTTSPYTATYQPPVAGTFSVTAQATDSSGKSRLSAPVSFTVTAPTPGEVTPSLVLSSPMQGVLFTTGSTVYLNYTCNLPKGVSIAESEIYVNGEELSVIQKVGPSGLVFAAPVTFGTSGTYTVYGYLKDSRGLTATSGPTVFTVTEQRQSPPSPLLTEPYILSSNYFSVGEPVTLRARVNFLGNSSGLVEFYANGVFLGVGQAGNTTNTDGTTTHSFTWVPNVAGADVELTARATGLNFAISANSQNLNYYASVVSSGSTTPSPSMNVTINEVPSNPGLNGAFVVEAYNKLLYVQPFYSEWKWYVDQLDEENMDRADVVMQLMGFDAVGRIFNQETEYALTSAQAFAPFGRLGLVPTQADIDTFLRTLEAGRQALLPLTGAYSGIPNAPYEATYALAQAMQQIFNSDSFRKRYPEVTGMTNRNFVYNFLAQVMFPGRYIGPDSQANQLVDMMDSFAPQSNRQGAAAAFLTRYFLTVMSDRTLNLQPEGLATRSVEEAFQRKLNTAALQFQWNNSAPTAISAKWFGAGFASAPDYSKETVQEIIDPGYVPPLRAQTVAINGADIIEFRKGRKITLSATTSSGLPPTFTSSNPSVLSISGRTATIRRTGTVSVTASVGGNGSYNPGTASKVYQIVAPRRTQSISRFSPKTNITRRTVTSFTLSSRATSGLAVTYASSNPAIISIVGNRATVHRPGTVTITASQAGNTRFRPAASVRRNVRVW